MIEALAAAFPIDDIVDEFAARLVARHPQYEFAVGAPNRLARHCTRVGWGKRPE
jgi:hypothetical protein